jgi:hypothetical protein
VAAARKVYNPIGFSKGYNFVLFFIFSGAFFGFSLARLQFFALDRSCASTSADSPLDCYYYTGVSVDRIGIIMHLVTILPAALLTCAQFVPVIRRTFVLFHRINGYIILVLSLVSTVGGIMLARNAVGGWMDVQVGVGVMSIAFLGSLSLALYNIKRLQIEQHRAWMLRAWFYVSALAPLIRFWLPNFARPAPSSLCGSSSSCQHISTPMQDTSSRCLVTRYSSWQAPNKGPFSSIPNVRRTSPVKT